MNLKRFHARTSREALAQVREAFGDDAVVLSSKNVDGGVEVLAMPPEGLQQIEAAGLRAPAPAVRPAAPKAPPAKAAAPATGVEADIEQLSMSTLSFQDYVRERMLKRRRAAIDSAPAQEPALAAPAKTTPRATSTSAGTPAATRPTAAAQRPASATAARPAVRSAPVRRDPPVLTDEIRPPQAAPMLADAPIYASAPQAPTTAGLSDFETHDMMNELRSMKGLIEERFGALAFMEKLQRQPRQARLAQRLLDAGFTPGLIRKLASGLPAEVEDEMVWAGNVLERNLHQGSADSAAEPAIEDQGGVYALIGSTGVGKTTSTAKIAAAFATRHGAGQLGLITLDAYRLAAHEQLRAYGRILGVPVHTAHDRSSLEDLLELLGGKKLVLVDTAGIAQRDSRTRELLEMLRHPSIKKLLVVNAAAQGETIEDVMLGYQAHQCAGVVLSKVDEAVKLGPAIDALIRHRQKVIGVANGQRVPEDWHRLSAQALVKRALREMPASTYRFDPDDVNLVFAAARPHTASAAVAARA